MAVGYMLDDLVAKFRPYTDQGRVAGYIPELLKANPQDLGIAIYDRHGHIHTSGAVLSKFTLQSVSKPFALALALMDHGPEGVFSRIGMEPTGDSFNSLMKLETFKLHQVPRPKLLCGF
ncbi:MAG: Glutaminase 2 [Firmicutes bacterium]|nr:Glutaminase 2 [Bacillota bacterium]